MKYNIQQIAAILQCDAQLSEPGAAIEHLLTDSRRLVFAETTLFFALQTEKRDGHLFIEELYNRGVKNFVVKKIFDSSAFASANFIFTDDALQALQQLAAYHRRQFHYPVIGITGSNGKTIVKEWLHQLLSSSYNIVRSPRSYNSQVGVPLSLWLMKEEYSLGVFEAGISKPGEMQKLEKMIQPSIGIFSNIGEAHGENFLSQLEKAKEKCLLFQHAEWLVYPHDNPVIQEAVAATLPNIKTITWGRSEDATVQIIDIVKQEEQTLITILFNNSTHQLSIPFTDDASEQNALSCITTLLQLDIDAATIQQKLLQLQAVDMRLQLMEAINQCSVINDSYSFDITSFSAALDFLLQQHRYTNHTVIISDLPETTHINAYTQVAEMMRAKNIQRIITVGEQWLHYESLLKNHFSSVQQFISTEELLRQFSANHFRSEVILLKGARRFAFEKISDRLEKKVHQTVMEINLTALAHNLNQYMSTLRKDVKVMAMVKAFGYGSGSTEIANLLQFHKADYLGVAYSDEGAELRNAGISLPIMVMNVDEAAFESIIQHNLEPELFSFQIFNAFTQFLQRQGLQEYPVHIKLDTGMHRLGFEEKDMPALCALLQHNKTVAVESVFSHLAASEDAAHDNFTMQQAAMFERCCNTLQQALPYTFLKHIANTAAITRMPALQFDMVRLGIGLYGIDNTAQKLSLQNVITLKTTVAQVKKIQAGDTVGYGRKGIITKDSIIATIRIGYADGFDRRLSNGIGKVYINGMFAPVTGAVAMDMAMIDVTNIPNVQPGDEAEIFGAHISVSEVAAWCGTIPYEILTGINLRVKRVYMEE